MIVECAWCAREGLPTFLRYGEPLDSNEISHGICDRHEAEVMNLLHDMNRMKVEQRAQMREVMRKQKEIMETMMYDHQHQQEAMNQMLADMDCIIAGLESRHAITERLRALFNNWSRTVREGDE